MESELDQNLLVRAARAFGRGADALEGWLCVLFGSLILLGGGFGAVVAVANCVAEWGKINPWLSVPTAVGAMGWLMLDLPYMFRLMLLAIRGERQVGLNAALQEPMPPWVLRPLVALWWAAHFAMAGWMAAMFHLFSHHGTGGGQWVVMILAVAAGFAANGFLMLSVCASTPSPQIRLKVWRYRLLIDVALALFGIFVVSRIIRP